MRRILSFLSLFLLVLAFAAIGTSQVINVPPPVPLQPFCAEIQTTTIQFVCPNCGASYETIAVLCEGEVQYRVDSTCPNCGYNYYYQISRWPQSYASLGFYFYDGYWYHRNYWNRYWRFPFYPRNYSRSAQRPFFRTAPHSRSFGPGQGRIDTPYRGNRQQAPIPHRPVAPRGIERSTPTPHSPPAIRVRPSPAPRSRHR